MERTQFADMQDSPSWSALLEHADQLASSHIYSLFEQDQTRFEKFHVSSSPILFDYSKQLLTEQTVDLLFRLAEEKKLPERIAALFSGEHVNSSEDRPAMHWALRSPATDRTLYNGNDISQPVAAELDKIESFADIIRSGQWRGFSGYAITDVVNIGVGGSDLGPMMSCMALEDCIDVEPTPLQIHFVSSMDGTQLSPLLDKLNPHTTLFILSSKSFTTIDTLSNAATALNWLTQACPEKEKVLSSHFIGISAQQDKMSAWGIPESNQLYFWDWVGGRYSMWSSIGFPIALKLGIRAFKQLLAGAHFMDKQFQNTPWQQNLPVLLGLIGVWNSNFQKINTHAILPYDGRLKYLPTYLSQLEMESNGKSVTRTGQSVAFKTCPILWGEVGPNAQHAFYQLLHQGTERVSCDFIAPAMRYHEHTNPSLTQQHELALANCFAQSRLLALGERVLPDSSSLPSYKRYPGNQPSSTIILDELTPFSLGALIALYEHKVFVQSVIWDINPFDQWGVELGKKLASDTLELLQGHRSLEGYDPSTSGLVAHIVNAWKQNS
ncbi:glucose-6-phosphate isomerase [Pokkaliibacter plantistimulans]|uniref:Glucose-6-phosphate isomerase n=1 Tax=Proteobacteria bacterium 228 TaxID=2083153 RepID=A0A2S5KIP6_9PROT|nr:glucose-6-phosphate isomerase [Pokkaliibacter plantistimulans]PPC74658.1 glucose-6-phosphate isomerase [Pokkaliibacter plantistimulans]